MNDICAACDESLTCCQEFPACVGGYTGADALNPAHAPACVGIELNETQEVRHEEARM